MSIVARGMRLRDRLEIFLKSFNVEHICDLIDDDVGLARSQINEILLTFSNEAKEALHLVEKYLDREFRILEVGAGICLFSLFLKVENFNVVALEPALGGFRIFTKIQEAVLTYYSNIALPVLQIPAQNLNSETNGQFDLIFSNNVIEHIPDLPQAFSAMSGVLAKNGLMVHACPNYCIPYEPHFGVPVIKKFPELSKHLFRKRIEANIELWNSLNFISYLDVKSLIKQNRLNVHFKKGVLRDTLMRLEMDRNFRERHSNPWILSLFCILKWLGVLRVLQYFPTCISTPMVFICSTEKVHSLQ